MRRMTMSLKISRVSHAHVYIYEGKYFWPGHSLKLSFKYSWLKSARPAAMLHFNAVERSIICDAPKLWITMSSKSETCGTCIYKDNSLRYTVAQGFGIFRGVCIIYGRIKHARKCHNWPPGNTCTSTHTCYVYHIVPIRSSLPFSSTPKVSKNSHKIVAPPQNVPR